MHEDDDDSPENVAWKTDHQAKCKANFQAILGKIRQLFQKQ